MRKAICPKCGSGHIYFSQDKFFRTGRSTQEFICMDCGYIGPLVIESGGAPNPAMMEDMRLALEEGGRGRN